MFYISEFMNEPSWNSISNSTKLLILRMMGKKEENLLKMEFMLTRNEVCKMICRRMGGGPASFKQCFELNRKYLEKLSFVSFLLHLRVLGRIYLP